MAAQDPKLVTLLEARLDRFEKQLREAGTIADREVSNIENRFSRMNLGKNGFLDSFNKQFTAGLIGATAGAIGLGSAIQGIRNSIKELDDLGDMSERIGVSTDTIQTLKHTLGQAGGEAEQAEKALDKFSDTVAEAALSGGYLEKVFKANGLSLRGSNDELRKNEDLLVDVARLIAGVTSEQERINLATDFFGRQAGPKMVGMLLRIADEGLPALIKNAKEAGVVIEKELIEKAGELDKKFRLIEERTSKALKEAAVNFGGDFLIGEIEGVTAAAKDLALTWELVKRGFKSGQTETFGDALGVFLTDIQAARRKLRTGYGVGEGERKQLSQADADAFSNLNPNTRNAPPAVPPKPPPPRTILPPKKDDTFNENTDAFERQTAAIEKRIAILNAETAVIDQGSAARERARVVAELETAAKKANEAAGLTNTEVTAAQRIEIDRLSEAYLKAAKAAEDANSPLRQFAREANDTGKALSQVGVAGLKGLEDGLVSVIKKTQSASEAFTAMTDAIIEDILRLLIRKAILGPAAGVLDGVLSGGIPGFAHGTNSAPGGLAVVGERGPELVNLPKGSQVIPNHLLGKGGQGPQISVNLSVVEDTKRAGQVERKNDNGTLDLVAFVDSITAKNAGRPGSATSNALDQRNRITRR